MIGKYTVWPMVEPDLFSLQDEKKHSARRDVANSYDMSTLLGMEEYIDQYSTVLLQEFAKFARRREVVDIVPWLQYYAFDVVGELGNSLTYFNLISGFGKKFGLLNKEKILVGLVRCNRYYITRYPFITSSKPLLVTLNIAKK